MEDFSTRLRRIMNERGISQSELSRLSGIPKSALSQYMSGLFRPKQDRTLALAKALAVDPAWLLGYDVPSDAAKKSGSGTKKVKRIFIFSTRTNRFHRKKENLFQITSTP